MGNSQGQNNNNNDKQKQPQQQQKKNENSEGGGGGKKDDGLTSAVLKVVLDCECEGCAKKVREMVRGIEGVESVKGGPELTKLTVSGKIDPVKLRDAVEQKTKKKVQLVSPLPKKDNKVKDGRGEGEKKGEGKPGKKPDEKKPSEKGAPPRPPPKCAPPPAPACAPPKGSPYCGRPSPCGGRKKKIPNEDDAEKKVKKPGDTVTQSHRGKMAPRTKRKAAAVGRRNP
ncbi:hypothetical protein Vadar_032563 [Vaccinium darrowii]|uniref:Uncharacterized protein n=1 Tax=Vaccinium darrowii TaxID=229202 RepID=A0ACB7XDZ3_9ERIC|nr:hypothetical protein Vadar_032563 [Vaccinium darrowii]